MRFTQHLDPHSHPYPSAKSLLPPAHPFPIRVSPFLSVPQPSSFTPYFTPHPIMPFTLRTDPIPHHPFPSHFFAPQDSFSQVPPSTSLHLSPIRVSPSSVFLSQAPSPRTSPRIPPCTPTLHSTLHPTLRSPAPTPHRIVFHSASHPALRSTSRPALPPYTPSCASPSALTPIPILIPQPSLFFLPSSSPSLHVTPSSSRPPIFHPRLSIPLCSSAKPLHPASHHALHPAPRPHSPPPISIALLCSP